MLVGAWNSFVMLSVNLVKKKFCQIGIPIHASGCLEQCCHAKCEQEENIKAEF